MFAYSIRREYVRYKNWNSYVWSYYARYKRSKQDTWHDYAKQSPYQNWEQAYSVLEKHANPALLAVRFVGTF